MLLGLPTATVLSNPRTPGTVRPRPHVRALRAALRPDAHAPRYRSASYVNLSPATSMPQHYHQFNHAYAKIISHFNLHTGLADSRTLFRGRRQERDGTRDGDGVENWSSCPVLGEMMKLN